MKIKGTEISGLLSIYSHSYWAKPGLFVVLSILMSITTSDVSAQHGISLTYAPSKVLKHSERLLFSVPDLSHEVRLSYVIQTSGKNHWERYWGKPKIVVNALFVNFGDRDILGNAYAILPELHLSLKKWKKIEINFQFGGGLAYLNKPFDAISNPINNAIGSNINNVTSIKIAAAYRWNQRWVSTLSSGLVHFSNGLSSSPNRGINIYGLNLSTTYFFNTNNPTENIKDVTLVSDIETKEFRRWIFDAQYHYGVAEHTVPGGPKYGINSFSVGGGYRYTKYMTILLGGEYEYNEGRYIFFRHNFHTESEAREMAKSTMIYASHEFRFGNVFNRLRLGFYLPYPGKDSRLEYIKVAVGYYLPEIKGYTKPYFGVLLKTHATTAEYVGILIGVSI